MATIPTQAKRARRLHVEVPAEWLIDAVIVALLLLAFTVFTWT